MWRKVVIFSSTVLLWIIATSADDFKFCGTFTREVEPRNTKFTEVLREMGYAAFLAKNITDSPMSVEFKEINYPEFLVTYTTPIMNSSFPFRLEEEFEVTLVDGRICKTTVHWVGSLVIHRRVGHTSAWIVCQFHETEGGTVMDCDLKCKGKVGKDRWIKVKECAPTNKTSE